MSKSIRLASIGAVPVVVALGLWLLPRGQAAEEQAYRTGAVTRGTVESVVSATGTLQAVTAVQVGTQVSGQVAALYADFNDAVRKGQLIARIDPTLPEQAVAEAEAGLARNRAELTRAQQERDRTAQLHESKVVTDVELNTSDYTLAVARANVRSAEVALARARRNLAYTRIYAPIDGIIVERNVDVGQTVAASLSAPQLFLIAQDLSELQILASVDESDIAQIKEGGKVRFTVQAYQDRTFEGTVRQVRLQSATQENVVSYKAVVAVSNQDHALLPGMTATVEFLTAVAADVLVVPNAALRFQPTDAGAQTPQNLPLLWYQDGNGKLAALPVRTGISDGQKTEVRGQGVKEGMQVVLGTRQAGASATAREATANPFQQPQQQRRQGGPPGAPGGF